MPNIYPGYIDYSRPTTYDLDKAKQLLEQAGHGGGFQTTLSYNAGDPVQEPIAILYPVGAARGRRRAAAQEGAGRHFLQLRLRPRAADDLLCRQPLVPGSGLLDAALLRQRELRRTTATTPTRRSTSCSPKTASTADDEAARSIDGEAQKIVMDEAPWTFIAYPNYTMARKADLKGWTYYTSNNSASRTSPRLRRRGGARSRLVTSRMRAAPSAEDLDCAQARRGARSRVRGAGCRFFLAVLRGAPAFALGYGIVGRGRAAGDLRAAGSRPSIPVQANPAAYLQPPGWPHLMGTDATGMDIFSRVIYAPRIDLDDRARWDADLGR